MATLNLSTNGPSISKSYQSVVNSQASTFGAAASPTYGQWAIFSVSAPLVNAFQPDAGGKESVLKVQGTGEGELVDLIDGFSDGKVQFAFAKVKDPNTSLPKYVLIGWCGEGVPERTKGYFTSHFAAVSKVLHGYHVQITARSDRDLTPEAILQKVSDASGSNYSSSSAPVKTSQPPPPVASKPAFMPTRSSAGTGFNPLADRVASSRNEPVDEDGWGADAPQITRTQLEKVPSAYQPIKVNMRELSSQKQEPSRFGGNTAETSTPDVVKGAYQPVGKVDIAAIRRQAQPSSTSSVTDDRPNIIKGAYEPVGKVDIAAIRAKAQRPDGGASPPSISPAATGASDEPKFPSARSAPFSSSERLTSMPKPKVANRFGSTTSTFAGTKAPIPGAFGLESQKSPTAPIPGATRTFADEGGKTPAQIWQEKKARERGLSGAKDQPSAVGLGGVTSPLTDQTSGGGEWKSGYTGKSWASVQIAKTGQSIGSVGEQHSGDDQPADAPNPPAGGVGAIRDRFKEVPPMGAAATGSERPAPSPPTLDTVSKPATNRGVPMPGLPSRPTQQEGYSRPSMPTPPPQPPRNPTPPTPADEDPGSPIRVAAPVGRGSVHEAEYAQDEQFSSPPTMPARSIAKATPHEEEPPEEAHSHDATQAASEAVTASTFGHQESEPAQRPSHIGSSGKHAIAQYSYEKAEDNELELREGEQVTDIDMVDEDWWMGKNERGETGLFPSNYVELVEDRGHAEKSAAHEAEEHVAPAAPAGAAVGAGVTATAIYDYEAAEDNELTFAEHDKITNVQFPDEDWWSGECNGQEGLFPANYVQLDE